MTCVGDFLAGPIIESKGMRAMFDKIGKKKCKNRLKKGMCAIFDKKKQKKGKKRLKTAKKAKYLKI